MTAKNQPLEKTADLVLAAQGGDDAAMDRLFSRYLPRVRLIVAVRTGWSPGAIGEVDDLAQEALLKAFRGLDSFQVQTDGSFRGWMASIVQSVVVDAIRQRAAPKHGGGIRLRRLSELGPDSISGCIFDGDAPTASAILSALELEEKVLDALQGLSPHHREAIVLVKLCGMSAAEAAKVLELSPGNVRVVLSRALKKLKARVDEGVL